MSITARIGLSLTAILFCVSGSASAAPIIVGTFNFTLEPCDTSVDPSCVDSELLSLSNDVFGDPLYGDLTFFADVALGASTVALFDNSGDGVLIGGESAIRYEDAGIYFSLGSSATLNFFGGNFADYGFLSLSNNLDASHSVANVLLDPQIQPVPEPGTLLLLATGLAAAGLRRRWAR